MARTGLIDGVIGSAAFYNGRTANGGDHHCGTCGGCDQSPELPRHTSAVLAHDLLTAYIRHDIIN